MKIFLSAVTSQLKACRDALRSDLSAVGAEVVVQEDFQQYGASLLEKLERYISSCDRIIALVGDAYGFEPEEEARPAGRARRSYTQWEYYFAKGERLDGSGQAPKDIFLYIGSPEFLAMHPVSQSEEAARLQQEFIKELVQSGKDRNQFSALHELRALVLRDGFRLQMRGPQARRLPYTSLGRLFKGREHILAELQERLGQNPERALVIYGQAGVGKTRLTIEYALRHEAQYTALLTAGADSGEALQRNLAALCSAQVLNLAEREAEEQEVQVGAVQRWLSEHSGWLLILDNADTPEAAETIEALLPRLHGGHVIITSRLSDWSGSVETVELELLSEDTAVEFLLERTKNRRVNDPSDLDSARELAKELEGLALGLEQAGAFIYQQRCSFDDYLGRWRAREQKVRTWHDMRLMAYPLSIAATWETSFEELGWAARDMLNLLSWLAPEPIPRVLTACAKLKKQNAARDDALAQRGDVEEALAELAGFSMLKWEKGNQAFRIHRLVRDVIREQQPDEQRSVILHSALLMVDNYLPGDPPPDDVRSWPIWEPMVGHVRELISEAAKARIGQPTSRLASMLALFVAEKSLWPEAEALSRSALEIDEQILGPEHPTIAIRLNNLAQLLQATNRLTDAEPLMRRALSIDEKSYEPDHPNVAIRLNNLAQLLKATNRLREAEPLMRRALSIDEKSYGPEHPAVAIGLNNLAGILKATNRLREAEPLMRRALSIDEKSYGPEHPRAAIQLNNLAALLEETNRLIEAEPLMRRALAIHEKSCGPEHPAVAIDLNNLAQLLQATNRLTEAEPLMRRVLGIDEKSYGPEHPVVARDLNNLAGILQATNRLTEAEPLMRRALSIDEKSYGPEHPNVAIRLNNLAGLLKATEAEPLMRRALSIDEKNYGPEHPKVAIRLNNLARLLQATNRVSEAEPLSRRQVQIFAEFGRKTGHEHPHFRAAFSNYVVLLKAMGMSEDKIRARILSAFD